MRVGKIVDFHIGERAVAADRLVTGAELMAIGGIAEQAIKGSLAERRKLARVAALARAVCVRREKRTGEGAWGCVDSIVVYSVIVIIFGENASRRFSGATIRQLGGHGSP